MYNNMLTSTYNNKLNEYLLSFFIICFTPVKILLIAELDDKDFLSVCIRVIV